MSRLGRLFLAVLLSVAACRTAAAFTCAAPDEDALAGCLKRLPGRDGAASPADRRLSTPSWLDLPMLELQIFGPDAGPDPSAGPPWLQALDNFPTQDVMLLHSRLGQPVLIGTLEDEDPQVSSKPEVFVIAHWPEDYFAHEECAAPGDTGAVPAESLSWAGTPPAGARLLRKGTALAVEVAGSGDGGSFRQTVFVEVGKEGLEPLLCVRTYGLDVKGPDDSKGKSRRFVATGDNWMLRVTSDWHDGHADVLAVHDGRPARTIRFRWNPATGRYRQLDGR